MIRSQIHISQHVRGRPFAKEFAEIHAELFAARDLEKRIESAVRLYFEPAIVELERELAVL